jgi:hypothetical protein
MCVHNLKRRLFADLDDDAAIVGGSEESFVLAIQESRRGLGFCGGDCKRRRADAPDAFTDVILHGSFGKAGAIERTAVDGLAFAIQPTTACSAFALCRLRRANMLIRLFTNRGFSKWRKRAPSRPSLATGEVLSAWIRNILAFHLGRNR